jgi:hypothetical protein
MVTAVKDSREKNEMFCIVPSMIKHKAGVEHQDEVSSSERSNTTNANRSVTLVQGKKHLGGIDLSGLEAANSRHIDLSLLA